MIEEVMKLKLQQTINDTFEKCIKGIPNIIEYEIRSIVTSQVARYFGLKKDDLRGGYDKLLHFNENSGLYVINELIEKQFSEMIQKDIEACVHKKDLSAIKSWSKTNINKLVEHEMNRLLTEKAKDYAVSEAKRVVHELDFSV